MPLVQIRYRRERIPNDVFVALQKNLPAVVADALTCEEGGTLKPTDAMIEFDAVGPFDLNCKDLNIRIWAHDYPGRRGYGYTYLEAIRRKISQEVCKYLPEGVSWYVWVFLVSTSYGSDTVD